MKKIKFRGIAKCNAQPVFGDLVHYKGQIGINDYFVYPESVAQFVGYDKNGNEVYEGDDIISDIGEGNALIRVMFGCNGGYIGDTFKDWKLKDN